MSVSKLLGGALIAASMAGLMATSAQAAPGASCFFLTQWHGWKAPSPDVLYLKVGMHDVYRVDLSAGSSMLQAPGMHLDSTVRGNDSICSPLDLDLHVSDGHGFKEALTASAITKLTPEEVAAIPDKYRP